MKFFVIGTDYESFSPLAWYETDMTTPEKEWNEKNQPLRMFFLTSKAFETREEAKQYASTVHWGYFPQIVEMR